MYPKGARAERELIKIFTEAGYVAIRAAGSGVSSESPDILLFKKGKQFAFECKAWDKDYLNIENDKMEMLKNWEEKTGITTMIAWKISYDGWYFAYLSELHASGKSFSISKKDIKQLNRKTVDLLN